MQQLTGLDASFLALETANATGHVGGLSMLGPSGAPRPLNLSRLTEVISDPSTSAAPGSSRTTRCRWSPTARA